MQLLQTKAAEFGYLESGPTDSFPVLMLHGFSDDALAWEGVVACLQNHPLRLLLPHLRGYGPSQVTDKSAQGGSYAALGQNALDLPTPWVWANVSSSAGTGAVARLSRRRSSRRSGCSESESWHSGRPTARRRRMELPGVGHFMQREQSETIAREIVSHLRWRGVRME